MVDCSKTKGVGMAKAKEGKKTAIGKNLQSAKKKSPARSVSKKSFAASKKKTISKTKAAARAPAPMVPRSKRKKATSTKRPRTRPASRTIFFTGFPGFIGKRIVKKLFRTDGDLKFIFLVQEKFIAAANTSMKEIAEDIPRSAGKMSTVVGDITLDDLGLSPRDLKKVLKETTEFWHLAAIYDLAVEEGPAKRVNVEGTKRVLDLCRRIPGLKQHVYFSTCYVSGMRKGRVVESELEMGQAFKNHYESTKFKAEVLVRESMGEIPTIIIRPSVVIGDSVTGEVDKFDGPYPIIHLLAGLEQRGLLPKGLPLPCIGKGEVLINLAPVDYVVDATCLIAGRKDSLGKTFQVCDPAPMTIRELFARLYELFGLGRVIGGIPLGLIRLAVVVPVLKSFLNIQKESIPYMEHPVAYDSANVLKALEGSGIECPRLHDILPITVNYVRRHIGALTPAMY